MLFKLLAASALIAAGAAQPARASYTFDILNDPLGTFGSSANSLDNTGRVVGSYTDAAGTHAFVYKNGSYLNFDVPGAAATVASGINAAGQVVGTYADAGGASHGFVGVPAGIMAAVDASFAPASGATFAAAINNAGAIAGSALDAGSVSHGFLRAATEVQIDYPGADATIILGLNNAGNVVGAYQDSAGTHGFIRSSAGGFTGFDAPWGVGVTVATGINDLGVIVGYYMDGVGASHGFVESGGSFLSLDAPNALGFTQVLGVNDRGQIVGQFVDTGTGLALGFIATVPEPSTIAILGFGAVALFQRRRRG